MSIAAVPAYLGTTFTEASPALRFGLLLPVWTTREDQEREVRERAQKRSREGDEVRDLLNQGMDSTIERLCERRARALPRVWSKNDFAAQNAWKTVAHLNGADQSRMRALVARQSALGATATGGSLLCLNAVSTAPFTTGLGNEHPLENGFAFLNPYGIPYLPGSGVKGVLRQAARELASGEWGETQGWSAVPCYRLLSNGKPVVDERKQVVLLSMLDILFGRETPSGESDHLRGALCFWDVFPQIEGESLLVEVMTPHQTHYYQKKGSSQRQESPHESGSPNPICFLTVPPRSRFLFYLQCDLTLLARQAPDLARDANWKKLLGAAFTHAFRWLGFGAKNSVGYGAMEAVPGGPGGTEDGAEAARTAEEERRLAAMSPNMRRVEKFKVAFAEREKHLRGKKENLNAEYHGKARTLVKDALEGSDWTPEERRAAADAIAEWLPKVVERIDKDQLKKLKLSQLRSA